VEERSAQGGKGGGGRWLRVEGSRPIVMGCESVQEGGKRQFGEPEGQLPLGMGGSYLGVGTEGFVAHGDVLK